MNMHKSNCWILSHALPIRFMQKVNEYATLSSVIERFFAGSNMSTKPLMRKTIPQFPTKVEICSLF